MIRDDIADSVHSVIALVLKLPSPPPGPLVRADVPEWDSLNHVEILYTVEETLGVTFTEEEMAAFDGSTAIVTAAERHLAA